MQTQAHAEPKAMPSTSLQMSAAAHSAVPTEQRLVDEAVAAVKDRAREFARLAPAAKAALLRACIPRLLAGAPAWVADGARARGANPGEEWLSGPSPTIRMFRLLAESLDQVARSGRPPLGRGVRTRADGRLEIVLFPASSLDGVTFSGFSGHVLMDPGVDERGARERQAAFYQQRDPAGGVSVILGAGNVASIPPMDVATKMFIEGYVCVLKMNPVNEWVGPHLERALEPLISRGYLRIVYGGAEVGSQLAYHPRIDDVHITGSDRTHDMIVWGPPGPERDRRQAANDPLLAVPISSELGNVSPVAIVPHAYSEKELRFQARNVVSMVFNNGSFNCNAAKMLITATGWSQRDRFLDLVAEGLRSAPTRNAYYPGAFDRYRTLLDRHAGVERFGEGSDQKLQWALVRGLDAANRDEPLFRTEPFCGILSETRLRATDPAEFLTSAAAFMNDRLWGTLNAMIVIHPQAEADPAVAQALDRALVELRYGTVAINHWPALCYAFGTLPWGGHQSSTLRNIQSGLGWVHNTFMLDGVDKSVVRGGLTVTPSPLWFFDNPKTARVAPVVADMEASPSWLKLPGLLRRVLL
jgi:acyl-CoA reductase-like NAD-dependent aldehyde dehydrogenase